MTKIIDSCHRPINYLRISVTDRCNLRCVYCMPESGIDLLPHSEILSYEEIVTIARAAAKLGISKVRLTGGEPLVRANLSELVVKLAAIPEIDDISLTTNGILLKNFARELKQAGLKRVNVSLDSLDADKFERITRFHKLDDVLQGISAAKENELTPVKINVVVMRGINDDEITDFAGLTVTDGWHVRFIELMPFAMDNPPECHSKDVVEQSDRQYMSIEEVKERISTLGPLQPSSTIAGNGPAKYYTLPGANGTIGFISPVSEHFCFNCNRIRLTADGKIRPCLLSEKEFDIRPLLRDGITEEELSRAITEAIMAKPRQHRLASGSRPKGRSMSQLGG
jgi:cyclic pyranopterin phosphate synthase